jgi:hypothetical protein
MEIGRKDIVIAVLLLVILFMFFFRLRRVSYADEAPPDANSPAPSPQQPGIDTPVPSQLPPGSILSKMISEDCAEKYGAGWSRFTDTLCRKA